MPSTVRIPLRVSDPSRRHTPWGGIRELQALIGVGHGVGGPLVWAFLEDLQRSVSGGRPAGVSTLPFQTAA